jgi:hypothetical protein
MDITLNVQLNCELPVVLWLEGGGGGCTLQLGTLERIYGRVFQTKKEPAHGRNSKENYQEGRLFVICD